MSIQPLESIPRQEANNKRTLRENPQLPRRALQKALHFLRGSLKRGRNCPRRSSKPF